MAGTPKYPGPQILSSHDTKQLPELLAMVMEGRIAWPDFQRVFHWTEQQICGFLPSLLRGAPIPNMVFWKWAEGAGEAADTTLYKSLGCAGHYTVRRPELGVVDGGEAGGVDDHSGRDGVECGGDDIELGQIQHPPRGRDELAEGGEAGAELMAHLAGGAGQEDTGVGCGHVGNLVGGE